MVLRDLRQQLGPPDRDPRGRHRQSTGTVWGRRWATASPTGGSCRVMAPYDKYEYENDSRVGRIPDADGMGNIRIGTKFRLLGGMGSDTTLALNAFVEPATGDDEVAADDTGCGVGLDWRVRNWVFNVGYQDTGGFGDSKFDEQIIGGIGYAGRVVRQPRLDHRGAGYLLRRPGVQGLLRPDHGRPPVARRGARVGVQLRAADRPRPAVVDRRPLPGRRPHRHHLLPFGMGRREEPAPPPPPPPPPSRRRLRPRRRPLPSRRLPRLRPRLRGPRSG